jgi:hypothetical protein
MMLPKRAKLVQAAGWSGASRAIKVERIVAIKDGDRLRQCLLDATKNDCVERTGTRTEAVSDGHRVQVSLAAGRWRHLLMRR